MYEPSPVGQARPRDPAARIAGWLLLATAAATVVAVIGRVAAQADLATLAESLAAIGAHRGRYGLGGAGRLLSGLTLLAGAWFLLRTWIMRLRLGSRMVPLLLGVSGVATAISGAGAVILAILAPGSPDALAPVADVRWISGKVGFGLGGLALIAAALRQWRVGGFLRPVAPVSALVGTAMQLIWVDAAIMAHRVTGVAFLLWLVAIGFLLVTGRVEQRFAELARGESAA